MTQVPLYEQQPQMMQQEPPPQYTAQPYAPSMSAAPVGQVYGTQQPFPSIPQQQQPLQYVGGAAPGYGPTPTMYNNQSPMYGQQQYMGLPQTSVGVPPGMTRESLQPGYVPGLASEQQRNVFNPQWSFRDSFGNKRSKCCVIS